MKKIKKYYYNTNTHRFEKLIVPMRVRLLRIMGFLSSSIVTALILVAIAFKFLDSPRQKAMKSQMQQMTEDYGDLQKDINSLNRGLAELEQRDNQIYRSIFEAAPLPDSLRQGKKYNQTEGKYASVGSDDLIDKIHEDVSALSHRMTVQQKSYDTLDQLVKAKEKMLASIPAIQPISNKDLSHMASGFGYRIDPVYKTMKMHTGLDFAASMGTPIYATADGTVEETGYDNSGYGNKVLINHGYGYETLYGHMVKIKARSGEKVKRGQIIGWVGSTGKSTGPHCHYEVIRNRQKIDPIYFFFNDLSATEYDRLTQIAATSNQSFD